MFLEHFRHSFQENKLMCVIVNMMIFQFNKLNECRRWFAVTFGHVITENSLIQTPYTELFRDYLESID